MTTGRAFRFVAALLLAVACGPARAGSTATKAPAGSWVPISYADLLDREAIVRTGERLVDAVRRADRRGAVQPFVDRYSFLLPYAVAMVYGPDEIPQESLAERYAPGAAQPAWAAVLRGGRVRVTTDGRGRARVFVPGDDPRSAYRAHYGLLRHPLARLLPSGGAPLAVEVFAYRNEYRTSQLRLSLKPYRFRASRFPPGRTPVDLAELDRFFRQGGQLEGAELSREDGLVLYASRGPRQTLSGQPATLADFAAAYRAVFHAGDNEAFVSLDPNRDPTLATVNFGGLLEDTPVGSVVLAADKRFKTVCSGLDPDDASDVRAAIRQRIPTFLTNTERAFLAGRAPASTHWINTRYWFYPGSCGVEADPEQALAVVSRPRFTADAERFGEEYLGASTRKKKAALPPEIRDNIRHLNENYARYAGVFPEIRELTVVARLMAICAWLRKANPSWLDLDGLLAVELPAVRTPREIPRLMSAEFLSAPASGPIDADAVRRTTRVRHLNPDLDRTAAQVFGGPKGFAQFLSLRAGKELPQAGPFAAEATKLFAEQSGKKSRELVRTEADLRAFLRVAASQSPEGKAEDEEMEADVTRLRRLQAELAALTTQAPSGGQVPAAPTDQERLLREQLQGIMKKYHEGGSGKAGRRRYSVVQHTGGISMEPRLFTVRKTKTSPALERLRRASRGAETGDAGGWIRSRPPRPSPAGDVAASASAPARRLAPAATPRPAARPAARRQSPAPSPRPAPRPERMSEPPATSEDAAAPAPPKAPALRTIEVPSREGAGTLVGRLTADGQIVFSRAER